MLGFSLKYEQLDYKDQHTRDVIVKLLDIAEEQTGFYPESGHLFVEAYPQHSGGCVLYFTAVDDKSADKQSVCVPVIFRFEDIEVIISGASTLFKTYSHRILKSSLFYSAGSYYLVIYPLDQSQLQSVMLLGEYGELCGKGELSVAHLQEHCRCIMSDKAIECISYYLAENPN